MSASPVARACPGWCQQLCWRSEDTPDANRGWARTGHRGPEYLPSKPNTGRLPAPAPSPVHITGRRGSAMPALPRPERTHQISCRPSARAQQHTTWNRRDPRHPARRTRSVRFTNGREQGSVLRRRLDQRDHVDKYPVRVLHHEMPLPERLASECEQDRYPFRHQPRIRGVDSLDHEIQDQPAARAGSGMVSCPASMIARLTTSSSRAVRCTYQSMANAGWNPKCRIRACRPDARRRYLSNGPVGIARGPRRARR